MIIGYEAKRIYHNRSGLGNYGRNLIRALNTFYPKLELRLYNPWPGSIPFSAGERVLERLPNQRSKLYAQLWRRSFLSKQAKKEGVQIFHGLSAELPQGLQKQGIKSIVTVHDLIFLRYPNLYKRIDRKIYERKVRKACNQANLVVAISDQTRSDLIEYLGISPTKIKVIGQGCAPEFWENHHSTGKLYLDQYALPQKYALFVGTLEERKNPVLTAKACIAEKIPLLLVGRPKKYWTDFYNSLSGDEKSYIHPLKNVDQESLAGLYQNAQVFVYPSEFEGFGIPLVEAMACGTALISSKNSALKEVAGPGSILLKSNEQESLQKALRTFWDDEEYRSNAIHRNANFVRQFQDEVIAQQWFDTYRELGGYD